MEYQIVIFLGAIFGLIGIIFSALEYENLGNSKNFKFGLFITSIFLGLFIWGLVAGFYNTDRIKYIATCEVKAIEVLGISKQFTVYLHPRFNNIEVIDITSELGGSIKDSKINIIIYHGYNYGLLVSGSKTKVERIP